MGCPLAFPGANMTGTQASYPGGYRRKPQEAESEERVLCIPTELALAERR